MSELRVDVKQLIKDWNECPEDDGFDGDHPILLMAMDVDDLRARNLQLQQENKASQAMNDALVARVSRLHRAGNMLLAAKPYNCKQVQDAVDILNETESESLAEIKVAAIEEAIKSIEWGSDSHYQPIKHLTEYANQLRQQGKD